MAFNNVGVASTSGTTPNTVEAMAHDAIAFIEAMNLSALTCWAFPSVASSPRRSRSSAPTCCGASCSPRSAPQGRRRDARVGTRGDRRRRYTADHPAGVHLRLLRPDRHQPGRRTASRGADLRATTNRDEPTTWQTRQAQYDAVCTWGIPNHALLQRVGCAEDAGIRGERRQRPDDSPALLLPTCRPDPTSAVKIYPDSAHGFLFQHHAEFAADVDDFLA